jgi:hypothetical protein
MAELYEFNASNNRFVGLFPAALLDVPKLSYLDIWFNNFEDPIPPELFQRPYDAIFHLPAATYLTMDAHLPAPLGRRWR